MPFFLWRTRLSVRWDELVAERAQLLSDINEARESISIQIETLVAENVRLTRLHQEVSN